MENLKVFSIEMHHKTWPNAKPESITKEEVIQMGLSNDLFPPKTSKHVFFGDLPPIFYSIENLS